MATRRRWGFPGIATRYMMHEHRLSLGSSFEIHDEHDECFFRVDVDRSRCGETLVFQDRYNHHLCAVDLGSAVESDEVIIRRGGTPYANVKWPAGASRDRIVLEMPGGALEMRGNMLAHEYIFQRFGNRVAKVSKSWLRLADTYTVEVVLGQEDAVILAATIAVDHLVRSSTSWGARAGE
jgi:uncharacterized protein YxjI